MSFEESLFAHLTSVDAQVGAAVGDRVYPTRLPERPDFPAVTWKRVDARRIYTYGPPEDTDQPWVTARIQFDCWAKTPDEAMAVGSAVLADLSGYGGDMAGKLIGSSLTANELDDFEPATKLHRRILDFLISYEDDDVRSAS